MLKYALLGFLSYAPMTGYDLKQRIDRSTAHFWHAKLSQIYVTLKELEKEKLVRSRVKAQADRPDRRVYTLTRAGRKAFESWLAEPYAELSPKKETLVLKLFFSGRRDRQSILAELRGQATLHRQQLNYYRHETVDDLRQAREEFPELARDVMFWEATRRFGEKYEALYVQWIEATIALVERGKAAPGRKRAGQRRRMTKKATALAATKTKAMKARA